jgi:hypothetical protein
MEGRGGQGTYTIKNRSETLSRARRRVIRAINANPCLNKFLTLTFEENVTDLDYSNKEFKKWVQRVNYLLKKQNHDSMKYVAVIEFQKRGAVHYHVLCDLPYVHVNALADVWGHGFIKLNRIHGDPGRFGSSECDNVGLYVCKYMTADIQDERLKGRRAFLMSRNLEHEVEVVIDDKTIDLLEQVYDLEHLTPVAETSYENEYTGKVSYKQYNLKRQLPQCKELEGV